MWPTIAASPAAAGAAGPIAEVPRQRDAQRTFGDVEQRHEHAGRDARRAQDVRGAEIAAADTAQVAGAPPPREQQRERNRPDGIGHEDDDRHHDDSSGPPAQQGPRPAIVHLRAPKLDSSQVSGSQGF